MDWLEQQLKQSLERKQPSPDFAARVKDAARRPRLLRLPRWIPAAAAILVIAGSSVGYRWHEGVQAKNEVMTAMKIAARKLNRIQIQVKEASR